MNRSIVRICSLLLPFVIILLMTQRERKAIKSLYWFHRYPPASIARLLGLSKNRIKFILEENDTFVINPDLHCLVCGNENAVMYFIDGNEDNKKPKNTIMLCEFDMKMFTHLQMRKKAGILTSLS